jgi:hypothetical protein
MFFSLLKTWTPKAELPMAILHIFPCTPLWSWLGIRYSSTQSLEIHNKFFNWVHALILGQPWLNSWAHHNLVLKPYPESFFCTVVFMLGSLPFMAQLICPIMATIEFLLELSLGHSSIFIWTSCWLYRTKSSFLEFLFTSLFFFWIVLCIYYLNSFRLRSRITCSITLVGTE